MALSSKQPTTCRICESACGLLATVEGSRVAGLEPDPAHPISRGFACRKGTTFHELANAEHRLVHPVVDGERVSWSTANRTVGSRLRALLDRFGPDAVGLYSGNAVGHSLGGVLGVGALQRGLGTRKHYSCLTLDNSEMFAVAEWVFGHPLETFIADYAASDLLVLIGTDPLSSQPSQAQSHPDGVRQIRDKREVLWVVDPRRSSTASRAHRHLQPRTGTDVYLLAWLVRRALQRTPPPLSGLEALRESTECFDLERAVRTTGLAEPLLLALDSAIAEAKRPLVWCGLGVLLGPQGTLGYWLTLCLQALTGGIGPGRPWTPGGSGALRRLLRRVPLKGRDPSRTSRIGSWPTLLDTLPSATLAEDILTPGPGQLRALVVVGGEPLRSLPHSQRALEALTSLDLLVTIGLSDRGTAAHAHVKLPAATWLERTESGAHNGLQRPAAFHRTDPAVVPPRGEARSDWRILTDLTRAAGCRPFGSRLADLATRIAGPEALPLGWLGGVAPSCPPPRLAVPELLEALALLPDPEPGLTLLSTVRPPTSMNHWIRPNREPAATMHPDDLDAYGLTAGPVTFRTDAGELTVTVSPDPTLARGTVVIPFGGPVNPNALIGTEVLEPFTGQPLSNGTRVQPVG